MEGISKETLISWQKLERQHGVRSNMLLNLIDACKELPDQQWQTIEEFNGGEEYSWCWIRLTTDLVDMAYFADGKFYFSDVSDEHNEDEIWNIENITHVMPIKTPEAPK